MNGRSRRPNTLEARDRPFRTLDEGETDGDEMEAFKTSEFPTMKELQATTGGPEDDQFKFKIKKMFEKENETEVRKRIDQELEWIKWIEKKEIDKAAKAAARQRRMEEAARQRRMEEAARQRQMEAAARQRRMEEAARQRQMERPPTDIENAYKHGQPRAQLIDDLRRKHKHGGRRRSKKSDTTKKYKTRSKYRSRISTKRKNKNRRQTRK